MILDQRIYDFFPGKVPEYMAAVRELAVPIRRKYGVILASWYYTEVGSLNRVYHTWAYRDWQHFGEAKEQVRSDPEWKGKYVPRVQPLIKRQRNQIVNAADFSPVPLMK